MKPVTSTHEEKTERMIREGQIKLKKSEERLQKEKEKLKKEEIKIMKDTNKVVKKLQKLKAQEEKLNQKLKYHADRLTNMKMKLADSIRKDEIERLKYDRVLAKVELTKKREELKHAISDAKGPSSSSKEEPKSAK